MIFYELSLTRQPRIRFACSVVTDHYANRLDHPSFFEYGIPEEGTVRVREQNGEVVTYSPGLLLCTFPDADRYCDTTDALFRHTSVGIEKDFTFTRYDSRVPFDYEAMIARVAAGESFLAPLVCDPGDKRQKIVSQMKEIEGAFVSGAPEDAFRAIGGWYGLAATVTALTLHVLAEERATRAPAVDRYAKRAALYLEEHCKDEVTVGEVAAYLGISEGYLYAVFREAYGIGVAGYLSRFRVRRIAEMAAEGVTLAEAAARVGVSDPSYASRLFRKVMGVSFRTFCERLGERGDADKYYRLPEEI